MWLDRIFKMDNHGQLGALFQLCCLPLLFGWLVYDLVCQRYAWRRWKGWTWHGWRKPSTPPVG